MAAVCRELCVNVRGLFFRSANDSHLNLMLCIILDIFYNNFSNFKYISSKETMISRSWNVLFRNRFLGDFYMLYHDQEKFTEEQKSLQAGIFANGKHMCFVKLIRNAMLFRWVPNYELYLETRNRKCLFSFWNTLAVYIFSLCKAGIFIYSMPLKLIDNCTDIQLKDISR